MHFPSVHIKRLEEQLRKQVKDSFPDCDFTFEAGDIVNTPPLTAHAQKFTEDSVFLALSTRQREEGKYEDDTIAFPVIEGYLNKELKKS